MATYVATFVRGPLHGLSREIGEWKDHRTLVFSVAPAPIWSVDSSADEPRVIGETRYTVRLAAGLPVLTRDAGLIYDWDSA